MILTKDEITYALSAYLRVSRASAMILLESLKVLVNALEHGRQGPFFPIDTSQDIKNDVLKGYETIQTDKLSKLQKKVKIDGQNRKNFTDIDNKKIYEILKDEKEKGITHSSLRLKSLVPGYTTNQYSNAIGRFYYHIKRDKATFD
jgi:hypothetical protein